MNLEKSGQICLEKLFSERTVYKMKAICLVMEQFKSLYHINFCFLQSFMWSKFAPEFFALCKHIMVPPE